MKKLTGKGKHTGKVRNHPHTKLVGRFKDKSNKIIYIHNKHLKDKQNSQMYSMISKTVIRGEEYKCRVF